ncbi:LPXTG cell wall anchor domain-containing protein [Isoptericola jiangsuensis]|uniref:LPXTG cell wall anchor domain-containing protein n=1 Tax=Isoptericola jiangsuensis TaxID=548579 RepID=UPI0014758BCC|nr:LPXTG cell wall anchor domain-containing protein [Isoptericola jiangsuensis]
MRRRAMAGTGLAVALLLGGAGTAFADIDPEPSPGTSDDVDGYAPEPVLTVGLVDPVCDGDVPYLRYAVSVENLEDPPDTVTITWVNPGGANVVQPDLPLSGRVLWPGAVVGDDGTALDWPGWRLEDGVWVEGDEFDWVRPSVGLEFEVNPTATATVGYPESSPACATPPGETPPPETTPPGEPGDTPTPGTSTTELPRTGAEVAGLVALAVGLVAAGTAAVLAVRRRRTTED